MSLTPIPPWLLSPRLPPTSPELYLTLGALNVLLLSISWLAQRQGTRWLRLGLTPVFFGVLWRLSGGVEFGNRHHLWLNYIWGLAGCYLILLIPRLTFFSEPYTYDPQGSPLPPSTTIDLLINPSLHHWSTPSAYYTSPPTPSTTPPNLTAWGHFKSHLRAVAVLMATLGIAALFPKLMSSEGATLNDHMVVRQGLGMAGRVLQWVIDVTNRKAVEVVVSLCFGVGVYLFIEIIYHGNAAVCIALFGWPESSFPEIFDKPWSSSSMHEFWSKRWHPLFSPTFTFYTLPFLSSPLTTPLALPSVFLLSGLIHDFGALPFDPHLDFSHITLFFFAQFVPLGIERAIRAVGGPRVGGWWGFVGTWGWMFVTGRWVVEGWLKKGLLGQVVKTVYPFLQD